MRVEIILPKMTDHMESAEVVRWLVREGERVEARQPILEVMTDKVTARSCRFAR
jgi:pyruvate/2-oxoglutarate dehydrogenase complex dihydrolipoamide acyltransferase (E2) component